MGGTLDGRYDDTKILRFLKSREMNVEQAANMILANIRWRKENRVDQILEEFPASEVGKIAISYWPLHEHGLDKAGIPVFYQKVGSIDIRKLMQVLNEDVLIRLHIYHQERADKMLGNKINNGVILINDLSGLGWKHTYSPAFSATKKILSIDANHYPGTLRKCYVIRTPMVFNMFWQMIKSFLHPSIIQKVFIYGDDFMPALQQDISPENIPAEIGGNCRAHKQCIIGGGEFVCAKACNISTGSDLPKEIIVKARAYHEIPVILSQGNSIVWNFSCVSHAIGFFVQCHGVQVVAFKKYEANEWHQGQLSNCSQGIYLLVWDNTSSKFKSKQIKFTLEII